MEEQELIDAIQGYAGTYAPSMIRRIVNGLDIVKDVNVIRNLTAKRNLWKFVAGKGLRPLDVTVNQPKGNAGEWSKRTIEPKLAMKILKIIPEKYRDTFLSEQLSEDAVEYPEGFKQYFWEEQTKEVTREMNDHGYYGVDPDGINDFNPASTYAVGNKVKFEKSYWKCVTITTAGQSPTTHPAKWEDIDNECLCDGLGTIIDAERTAGNLSGNVVATGLITSSNALDKIDDQMWKAIPYAQRKYGITFYLSPQVYEHRQDHLRDTYSGSGSFVPEREGNMTNYIIGSNKKGIVKECSWMGDAEMVVATVEKNLTMGTNILPKAFGKIIEDIHDYRTALKMILCYQVQDLEALHVNDQK